MEQDCILQVVLRATAGLSVRGVDVRLGVLGSAHYRGREIYFCSVDVRLAADFQAEAVQELITALLPQLQLEPALLTFIRQSLGPELQILARPSHSAPLYYSSTDPSLQTLEMHPQAAALAIQLTLPSETHDFQQEVELLEIYLKSHAAVPFTLAVNGVHLELFAGSNVKSLQLPTREQVICSYEEAADIQNCLNVLLSVSVNGVPVPASDSLFDIVSYRLYLQSESIFTRQISTASKRFYTQMLTIADLHASVSLFHLHISLLQALGINSVLDWAFQAARGVLMAEVLNEGEFEQFFAAVFAESAANLVAQICDRGGREELDVLFPEPMSTEDLTQTIYQEALPFCSH